MKLSHTVWRICLRKRSGNSTIIDNPQGEFLLVPNPPNGWAADPFLVERGDSLYIFAEVYDLSKFKGDIGYCYYRDGRFSEWKNIITSDYHFSYPYIFEKNGEIFIMPEAGRAGLIPLYKCTSFPDQWEELNPVFQGKKMADTTFVTDDYLISQLMIGNGRPNKAAILKVYEEENGQFTARIVDAVEDKMDLHRPAGKCWKDKNKVLRPAQNSQNYYGESLVFYEINIEDLPHINESEIGRLEASTIKIHGLDRKLSGMHTYNFTDHYEVVDVKYETVSITNIMRRLFRKVYRR